jgi:hypothetical protein
VTLLRRTLVLFFVYGASAASLISHTSTHNAALEKNTEISAVVPTKHREAEYRIIVQVSDTTKD